MLTKHEIIDETVEYYQHNDRALTDCSWKKGKVCTYLTSDGLMCAVGRCLNTEFLNSLPHNDLFDAVEYLVDAYGAYIFKSEYQGHELHFWADLQALHDEDGHWDNKTLTSDGEDYVDYLKQHWSK